MGKKTDLESVHLVNHSKCMLAAFQNFRQDETMLDVTLVCNGISIKAHKLLLSACSPFFKELFIENPCAHPIIILRDFEFADLKAIIDFIYKGELSVPRERLMSALKVAEELHIRGLRRSEPNQEKYEKLYNQVRGKFSGRKKRKRQRHNSSDSDGKDCVSVSDSDQNVIHSEESLSASGEVEAQSEFQPMDVEAADLEGNSTSEKDIRPVVLRVGEPVTSNEENVSENAYEAEESSLKSAVENNSDSDVPAEDGISTRKEDEEENFEADPEDIPSSSQFEAYTADAENSNLEYLAADEQNNYEVEQSMEPVQPGECSEEQEGFISSSCLSPNSLESQESDEKKSQDEGKRFVCSKCDSVFTSRINFMKHKAAGHNNVEKTTYDCQYCTFTTEELECFKSHLLIHSERVPYKCNLCTEEFTSEELYKKHMSLHEVEEMALHGLSPKTPEQDLFPTENKNLDKSVEFRCSICFIRFSSKLRCQIHEKTCLGGGS